MQEVLNVANEKANEKTNTNTDNEKTIAEIKEIIKDGLKFSPNNKKKPYLRLLAKALSIDI